MPRKPSDAPLELPASFLAYAKTEPSLSANLEQLRAGLDRFSAAERARKRRFAGKTPDELRAMIEARREEIAVLQAALTE